MKTLKQILRTLSDLENYEKRLDQVVLDSLEHCLGHTYTPEAINAVHAFLIAHNHTTLAKRFREWIKGTSPMDWHDKESTFKLNKGRRDKAEQFSEEWAANLGKYWRIQLDKPASEKKVRTLAERVKSAKERAEKEQQPSVQDRIAAAKLLLSEMAADEIFEALGNKAEFVAACYYDSIADQAA